MRGGASAVGRLCGLDPGARCCCSAAICSVAAALRWLAASSCSRSARFLSSGAEASLGGGGSGALEGLASSTPPPWPAEAVSKDVSRSADVYCFLPTRPSMPRPLPCTVLGGSAPSAAGAPAEAESKAASRAAESYCLTPTKPSTPLPPAGGGVSATVSGAAASGTGSSCVKGLAETGVGPSARSMGTTCSCASRCSQAVGAAGGSPATC